MTHLPPDPQEPRPGLAGVALRDRIAAFLAEHTTLTLATAGADGAPAAAAVFYAHDAGFNLYFLSEERTEHGRNLLADARVAGTIHADGQDWRVIRGLQVRGRARPAAGTELAHAAAVYGRKYAFVAGLLAGSGGAGVLGRAAGAGPVLGAAAGLVPVDRQHHAVRVQGRVGAE